MPGTAALTIDPTPFVQNLDLLLAGQPDVFLQPDLEAVGSLDVWDTIGDVGQIVVGIIFVLAGLFLNR